MEELLISVVSFIGIITALIINWIHNQNFVTRYNNYKNKKGEGIIKEYKIKFENISKKKDITLIEEEIRKMLKELEEKNVHFILWEEMNRFSKISFISFFCLIFLIIVNTLIIIKNMEAIIILLFIFSMFFLFLTIKRAFDLSKKISYWELGMEEPT